MYDETTCTPCPLKYYANEEQTECLQCPDFANMITYGQQKFSLLQCHCIDGYERQMNFELERYECNLCQTGKYRQLEVDEPDVDLDHSQCDECDFGKFQDETGGSSCKSCSASATTSFRGESTASACKCEKGFEGSALWKRIDDDDRENTQLATSHNADCVGNETMHFLWYDERLKTIACSNEQYQGVQFAIEQGNTVFAFERQCTQLSLIHISEPTRPY